VARQKKRDHQGEPEIYTPARPFVTTPTYYQVEVRLAAIVQHEALAVLKRAHGPRVAVQVWVNLNGRCAKAARFKQLSDADDEGET